MKAKVKSRDIQSQMEQETAASSLVSVKKEVDGESKVGEVGDYVVSMSKITPSIKNSFGQMNGFLPSDCSSSSSVSSISKSNLSMSSLSSNSMKFHEVKEKFNRSSILKKVELFFQGFPYVDQVIRLVKQEIFNIY
jgi:hypothetical protein